MIVQVYAKCCVDLSAKRGAWAYILQSKTTADQFANAGWFKKPIKTLAQSDCMAMINALDRLSTMTITGEITEIEVFTDSQVVKDLVEVYKFQKHCEEVVRHWKDTIKPRFTGLQKIKAIKVDGKHLLLTRCKIASDTELGKLREYTN